MKPRIAPRPAAKRTSSNSRNPARPSGSGNPLMGRVPRAGAGVVPGSTAARQRDAVAAAQSRRAEATRGAFEVDVPPESEEYCAPERPERRPFSARPVLHGAGVDVDALIRNHAAVIAADDDEGHVTSTTSRAAGGGSSSSRAPAAAPTTSRAEALRAVVDAAKAKRDRMQAQERESEDARRKGLEREEQQRRANDVVVVAVRDVWGVLGIAVPHLSSDLLEAFLKSSAQRRRLDMTDARQLNGQLLRVAFNAVLLCASFDVAMDDVDTQRPSPSASPIAVAAEKKETPPSMSGMLRLLDGTFSRHVAVNLAERAADDATSYDGASVTTLAVARFATTYWKDFDTAAAGSSSARPSRGAVEASFAMRPSDWAFLTQCASELQYPRALDLAAATASVPRWEQGYDFVEGDGPGESVAVPEASATTACLELLMLLVWLSDRYKLPEVAVGVELQRTSALEALAAGETIGKKPMQATFGDAPGALSAFAPALPKSLPTPYTGPVADHVDHHRLRLERMAHCAAECNAARDRRNQRAQAESTGRDVHALSTAMPYRDAMSSLAAIESSLATLAAQAARLGNHSMGDAVMAAKAGPAGTQQIDACVAGWKALATLPTEGVSQRRHACKELGEIVARKLMKQSSEPTSSLAAADDDGDGGPDSPHRDTVLDIPADVADAIGSAYAAVGDMQRRNVVRGLESGWQTHVRYGMEEHEIRSVRINAQKLKADAEGWSLSALMTDRLAERSQSASTAAGLVPLTLFGFSQVELSFGPDPRGDGGGDGAAATVVPATQPSMLTEALYPFFADTKEWAEHGGSRSAALRAMRAPPPQCVSDAALLSGLGATFLFPSDRSYCAPQLTVVGEPGPGLTTSVDLRLDGLADEANTDGSTHSAVTSARAAAASKLVDECDTVNLVAPQLGGSRLERARAVTAESEARQHTVPESRRRDHRGDRDRRGSASTVTSDAGGPGLDPFSV